MSTTEIEQRISELARQIERKDAALRRLVGGLGAMVPGDTNVHNLRIPADAIRQAQQALAERCEPNVLRGLGGQTVYLSSARYGMERGERPSLFVA